MAPSNIVTWRRRFEFLAAMLLAISCVASAAVPKPVGLINMGNTCYMNAQLQCAYHVPAFQQIVTGADSEALMPTAKRIIDDIADDATAETLPESDSEDESETPQKPPSLALLALRKVFLSMSASTQFPVSTREFCRQLGIPTMTQQDSQEFFKLLLPALESDELVSLYRGYFIDYIRALDGSGRAKERQEPFLDLSLDISKHSCVTESLKELFGEPETLRVSEGNGWRPEKGADRVDANKGASLPIDGLPPILQLHLKRFNYDWQTDRMTKLNRRVSFPETLSLLSICKGETNEANDEDDTTIYDLQSVVVHAGEYDVGHYYSYVRPDITSDVWMRFNDVDVQPVSYQEVVDDAFGGTAPLKKSSSGQVTERGGVLARINRAVRFAVGRRDGKRGSNYGFGGSSSNAYVLQYVRRFDQSKLYSTR